MPRDHDSAPSLRLLARRINDAEALNAELVAAVTRAHGLLVDRTAASHEKAAELLRLALRRVAAHQARR